MDVYITESISLDKNNQFNLTALLKKIANKKRPKINLSLYKSINNDHKYLLNYMYDKIYYNIKEIYNLGLSTLKGTNWLCGDALNVYFNL